MEAHLFTVERVHRPGLGFDWRWRPECPCGWTGYDTHVRRGAEIAGAGHRMTVRDEVLTVAGFQIAPIGGQ